MTGDRSFGSKVYKTGPNVNKVLSPLWGRANEVSVFLFGSKKLRWNPSTFGLRYEMPSLLLTQGK